MANGHCKKYKFISSPFFEKTYDSLIWGPTMDAVSNNLSANLPKMDQFCIFQHCHENILWKQL